MIRQLLRGLRRRWRHRHDGRRMRVEGPAGISFHWIADHRFPESMARGEYERKLVEALLEHLEPGDAFLDVGANAGYVSLCAKIAVGGEGEVIAFEPLPENVAMIRRVQAVNPELPFVVEAVAVAADRGTAELAAPHNPANPHLKGVVWEGTKPAARTLEIPTVGLREYIDRHRPTVVKIDVEGAEYLILDALGAPETWAAWPVFFVELHGEENRRRCCALFERWGYVYEALDGEPLDDAPPGRMVLAQPGERL